ncbi:MAG TPA: hypothetical protein VNH41_11265 [Steroidobacteraceae bacterium]|nr:hypothetical protein [Steroidobacteraceae bacterium]
MATVPATLGSFCTATQLSRTARHAMGTLSTHQAAMAMAQVMRRTRLASVAVERRLLLAGAGGCGVAAAP